jgi:predicted SAM-dependent methyltransferase
MKIQISPTKIIADSITVWHQPGPEVDIVMDIKNLTFKENSLDEIFTFHVLDHLFEAEVVAALTNWRRCLKPGARLFTVVDDFEYLSRAFVGGDINVSIFNANFSHPTQFTRESLTDSFIKNGFSDLNEKMQIWFELPFYKKPEHELIMSVMK